ncbi:MAG: T9SS type A sorting domain-containing protein, partial [Flavobacteriales bacterium]|nr:T9SS type A sorting domain-containing protein [Flavobacteriales bacterium]
TDNDLCTAVREVVIPCPEPEPESIEIVETSVYADALGNLQVVSPFEVESIVVYSTDGKIYFQGLPENNNIDMSGTDNGLFVVRIKTTDDTKTKKVVVD